MKQELWCVQFLIKVWVVIFYKAQNNIHAPAALLKLRIAIDYLALNYQN